MCNLLNMAILNELRQLEASVVSCAWIPASLVRERPHRHHHFTQNLDFLIGFGYHKHRTTISRFKAIKLCSIHSDSSTDWPQKTVLWKISFVLYWILGSTFATTLTGFKTKTCFWRILFWQFKTKKGFKNLMWIRYEKWSWIHNNQQQNKMHFLKTRSRIDTLPERQLAIKRLECNQNISTRPNRVEPPTFAHVSSNNPSWNGSSAGRVLRGHNLVPTRGTK